MIVTSLLVFVGLATCQVLLVIKLADWLIPVGAKTTGRGTATAGDAVLA